MSSISSATLRISPRLEPDVTQTPAAPAAAKARAMARPMPRPAPVMMANFPESSPSAIWFPSLIVDSG